MEEKRVLVTGAAGFIGSELALALATQGYPVVALARNSSSSEALIELSKAKNITVRECNLLDTANLKLTLVDLLDCFTVSAVFHCAAESNAEKCESDKAVASQINIEATRLIVEACEAKGIPIFFLSTDMVFSTPPVAPKDRFLESDQPSPRGVYPMTKYNAEAVVLAYRRGYVLRTALTLGIAKLVPQRGVLAGMLRTLDVAYKQRLLADKPDTLSYLDAFIDEWRTPVILNQLIESCLALVKMIENKPIPQLLNMAGRDRLSRYEIAGVVAEQFGYPAELVRAVERKDYHGAFNRPTDCSLSGELTQEALAVSCTGLREGLKLYAKTN